MVFVAFVYWLLVFGCWFCCLGLVGLGTGCVYDFRLWLFRCAAHWFWCFVRFRVWLWMVAGLLFLVRGVCVLWWVAAYLSRGCGLCGLVCGCVVGLVVGCDVWGGVCLLIRCCLGCWLVVFVLWVLRLDRWLIVLLFSV